MLLQDLGKELDKMNQLDEMLDSIIENSSTIRAKAQELKKELTLILRSESVTDNIENGLFFIRKYSDDINDMFILVH
jgi:hypothetical protein